MIWDSYKVSNVLSKLYICEIPIGNYVQNLRHNYNYYFGKNWKNLWSITGFNFTKLENPMPGISASQKKTRL